MKEFIANYITENQAKLTAISDQIWEFAETGLQEFKSSKLLADTLKDGGFTVNRGVADMPTAFVAEYGGGAPIIALLGEFDALPGLSQKTQPVKEPIQRGYPGHGCGHNLFGVGCLGAALAVKEIIDTKQLAGTVRYYGTPGEENAEGKTWMINAGLFDDVDISLTWHPGDLTTVMAFNFQAMYQVAFKFFGRASHAAGDPHNGRSALDAVELMNVGCNYLREHITTDSRIHYIITDGGMAPNIVPDYAASWYFIRAPKLSKVDDIYERIKKIASGAAMMTETEVEMVFIGGSANILPNHTLEDFLCAKMQDIGGVQFSEADKLEAEKYRETFPPNYFDNFLAMVPAEFQEFAQGFRNVPLHGGVLPVLGRGTTLGGSTDVGDVSWVTPTAEFGAATNAIGTPGHSWQMVAQSGMSVGHKGLLFAAQVLALATAELFQNPDLVKKAKQEFEKRKAEEPPYKCPLPENSLPPHEFFKERNFQ